MGKSTTAALVARFDLAWSVARVAIEFQSYRHHFGRQAWRQRPAGEPGGCRGLARLHTATEDDVRERCRRLVRDVVSASAA